MRPIHLTLGSKPMPEEFNNQYEAAVANLKEFGQSLESLIAILLNQEGVRVHSVTSRVKDKASTLRKLQRPDKERDLATLTDLLGVRIITYFRDDVDAVARVIEQEFSIDEENSVDKRVVLDPDRFGYLSLHYVARLDPVRIGLAEYRSFKGKVFELQIRSILQHAWAEIEHDLGYRSAAAVPQTVKRRFSRLAGLLELADDEFFGIRKELGEYQRSSEEAITKGDLQIGIDRDSLSSFIQSGRIRDLDQLVTHSVGREYGDFVSPPYIDKLVNALVRNGFRTIEDIGDFLDQTRGLYIEFVGQWVKAGRRRRHPGSKTPAGISIFYVILLREAEKFHRNEISAEDLELEDAAQRYENAYVAAARKVLGREGGS